MTTNGAADLGLVPVGELADLVRAIDLSRFYAAAGAKALLADAAAHV